MRSRRCWARSSHSASVVCSGGTRRFARNVDEILLLLSVASARLRRDQGDRFAATMWTGAIIAGDESSALRDPPAVAIFSGRVSRTALHAFESRRSRWVRRKRQRAQSSTAGGIAFRQPNPCKASRNASSCGPRSMVDPLAHGSDFQSRCRRLRSRRASARENASGSSLPAASSRSCSSLWRRAANGPAWRRHRVCPFNGGI